MINIYTFKGKVLILSFACLAMSYALTDAIHLFAMAKKDGVQTSINELIPVVVMRDGENKKIMSVNEFFRAASSNHNLSAGDMAKVVKLKNEIDLGKAQIDLFKKLTEKKEEGKNSFLMNAIKRGGNGIFGGVKNAAGYVVSIATGFIMIGGVACFLYWVLGPTSYTGKPQVINYDYCHDGMCYPDLCKDAWPWPLGPSDCK